MRFLKQSTSVEVPIGPFLDDTDGKTAETALTITQPDIRLKKNGGSWAQKAAAQTLAHEENGNYEVTLDATDTNTLGHLRLHVIESGALPVWDDFMIMSATVYDSLFAAAGGTGTFDSGTTTTGVDAARTEGDTDYWAGQLLVITSGNLAGQSRAISGFAPSTDTLTWVTPFSQSVATQTYEIWPFAPATVTVAAADLRAAVGLASANLDGQLGTVTTRLSAALAAKLAAHSAGVLVLVVGTGSTTSSVKFSTVDGAAPSSVTDFYKNAVIVFTSGALAGQRTSITGYDGSTTTATVTGLTGTPANAVTGIIV